MPLHPGSHDRQLWGRGWCWLVPDSSRRLLGSVTSTPFSARSTGQAQSAQKCAECQLCTRETESALRSHKKENMEFNFFLLFPQTLFRKAINDPLILNLVGSPSIPRLYLFSYLSSTRGMGDQASLVSASGEQFPSPACGCARWVRTLFLHGAFSAIAKCDVRCRDGECRLGCAWNTLPLRACPIPCTV